MYRIIRYGPKRPNGSISTWITCFSITAMLFLWHSQEDLHGRLPAFCNTKEGGCMKKDDFITITGWVFSLLSLLIAVYSLGKG